METLDAIKNRESTRKFSSKKPDWRDIIEAIHSSQFAPMAGGLFTLKFIIVEKEDLIKKIATWSEQPFIAQAKYVVVAVSNDKIVEVPYKENTQKMAREQAGAAIQNFLLHLTDVGLSTCWIGHFNEEKIRFLLKIPEENTIEAIFPIGYKTKLSKKKTAKEKGDIYSILYFDMWDNQRMRKREKIEGRGPEGL